mgnify:CR=1 FL=1
MADFGLTGPYRYALLTIDAFTKKLVVVLIKGETRAETAVAFEEVLKILDVPNYVYSDEGGEFVGAFEAELNREANQTCSYKILCRIRRTCD